MVSLGSQVSFQASTPPPRPSFLDRERTVAAPGFSRWLVPPAAIAVQMCVGEIYGFSVFNIPLTRAIGISTSQSPVRTGVFPGRAGRKLIL